MPKNNRPTIAHRDGNMQQERNTPSLYMKIPPPHLYHRGARGDFLDGGERIQRFQTPLALLPLDPPLLKGEANDRVAALGASATLRFFF